MSFFRNYNSPCNVEHRMICYCTCNHLVDPPAFSKPSFHLFYYSLHSATLLLHLTLLGWSQAGTGIAELIALEISKQVISCYQSYSVLLFAFSLRVMSFFMENLELGYSCENSVILYFCADKCPSGRDPQEDLAC